MKPGCPSPVASVFGFMRSIKPGLDPVDELVVPVVPEVFIGPLLEVL